MLLISICKIYIYVKKSIKSCSSAGSSNCIVSTIFIFHYNNALYQSTCTDVKKTVFLNSLLLVKFKIFSQQLSS